MFYSADLRSNEREKVCNGGQVVVRCLLSCGADGNVCGGVKDRPLHLAASRGLSAIASLLLEAGAD
ncbi:hypothetical protein COOONC_04298, partial [Cooperia oncophora]